MKKKLFRTGVTSLSDCGLSIVDILFDGGARVSRLLQKDFEAQWAVPAHSLSDDAVRSFLKNLVENSVLETSIKYGHQYVSLTKQGGKLWSSERCPAWNRYCSYRYPACIRGRTIISVLSISKSIVDDVLDFEVVDPIRCKKKMIRDGELLIRWKSFGRLFVGLASFIDGSETNVFHEFQNWIKRRQERERQWEAKRTWWNNLRQLQKFL